MTITQRDCEHNWNFLSATGRGSRPIAGKVPPRFVRVTCRACGLSAYMECAYRDNAPTVFDSCPGCGLSRGRPQMTYTWDAEMTISCPACSGEHPTRDVTRIVHGEGACYFQLDCGVESAFGSDVLVRSVPAEVAEPVQA